VLCESFATEEHVLGAREMWAVCMKVVTSRAVSAALHTSQLPTLSQGVQKSSPVTT